MPYYLKDPQARVDYVVDWGVRHLGEHLIATSTWSVTPDEPGGLAVAAFGHDNRRAQATIEGGVAGATYDVTNRIALTSGEIDERSISFRVEQR